MIHHVGRFVRGERSSIMATSDTAEPRSAQAPDGGPHLANGAALGTGAR